MSDQITFSDKERQKLHVIQDALERTITNDQAAKILGLSTRQIKRLKQRVKTGGKQAVIHSLKGKPSNHQLSHDVKETALFLIRKNYTDFKPTFASEKLQEIHSVFVHPQTLRRWMTKEGLWKPRKQKQNQYRSWRPRKDYYGELEQFDGSYHYWFENRYCNEIGEPIEVCLLAAIDDATGEITKASFAANEGVTAVFTFWKEYVQTSGKPVSIYLDKFSTYKINHKAAVDNGELMTQFQRAMQRLGIELITAHSPQAKGRVEKLFETLQDRLVKEMRLRNIHNPPDGNKFLKEVFLKKFNQKFAVIPAKEGHVHESLSARERKNLNRIFSIQSRRKVNNDFTIQFKNRWYQLQEVQPTTVRARDTITLEEWLDETIHLTFREKYLSFMLLPQRPQKTKTNPTILTTHKLNWKPPKDHPWKRRTLPVRG